jgi:hypothetical protein
VIGREIAVRDPEIPLQFNGVACSQRHHGLQPDGGSQRDMGGGALAEGAPDFCRAVQHQPPAHAGRGAGVDLVEQRRAEEVPDQFDRSRPNAVAAAIVAALREDGITAEASDVISHIKIELPTTQLAAASAVLADLQLI